VRALSVVTSTLATCARSGRTRNISAPPASTAEITGATPRRAASALAPARVEPRAAWSNAGRALTPAALDALLDVVTAAVRRVERLVVQYWTPSRDEVTERTITPRQVFHDRGEWYVVADDERSGERRTFRIDRMESVEPTGETGEPDEQGPVAVGEWFADGGLPSVTLRLESGATWVTERYPVDEVEERADGTVVARFPVASERWLERLLLRLGTEAEVVEPRGWRNLGRDAAGRLLARYATGPV
jgi:proteasome accessory factor C